MSVGGRLKKAEIIRPSGSAWQATAEHSTVQRNAMRASSPVALDLMMEGHKAVSKDALC